jgi:uncharacterized damage-inducible protein DinB
MSMLAKLVAHMEWADERALASLRGAAVPHAKAHEIYAHVIGAEHVWLSRIAGRAPRLAVWPTLTLDECEGAGRANAVELRALVASGGAEELQRVVHYTNSAGDAFDSKVEDMLLQLLLHGAYHRGQVAQLLRQGGAEPSPTDYIAFVRGAPAATRPPTPNA